LARDIHDSLGHHLTVIAVQLAKVEAFRQRDPAVADQALADARLSTKYALEEVRQSVGALHDAGNFALVTALRKLVAGLDGRLAVELDVDDDEKRFAGPTLLALYRAAQEGLTNARRHSGATRVAVRVRLAEDAASLTVADHGRGLDGAEPGFGLRGMEERVRSVGGSLSIESDPGRGTCLVASVPARGQR
jgi:signal transduction histidine kinase